MKTLQQFRNRLLFGSTEWIGRIAKKYPYLARAVESAFYGAIIAFLTALADQPENALGVFFAVFGAGIVSAIKKRARTQQERLEEQAE